MMMNVYEAFRDLVPFVQLKKKREKHPWRNVTFSKVEACNFNKSNTPPWMFSRFFKFYKWYQIAQRTAYETLFWKMNEKMKNRS